MKTKKEEIVSMSPEERGAFMRLCNENGSKALSDATGVPRSTIRAIAARKSGAVSMHTYEALKPVLKNAMGKHDHVHTVVKKPRSCGGRKSETLEAKVSGLMEILANNHELKSAVSASLYCQISRKIGELPIERLVQEYHRFCD